MRNRDRAALQAAGTRVVLVLVLAAAPASAQEDADPVVQPPLELQRPEQVSPEGVEAITITGEQINAADVQDEAEAVTAFNMEDLDKANIVNVENLAFSVPGLHVGQAGNSVIVTLRGIGTENASVTGETGVAFHVDGVYFARPAAAQVAFFDLETVRVERGPQGLTGGKNSTSGWINVVTNKPHDEYEVSADVQVGSFGQRRIRGAINAPINEFSQMRLAAIFDERDGYQDNVLLNDDDRDAFDIDDHGLRYHLRLAPSDALDILLSYNYYRQQGNGTQVKLLPFNPIPVCSVRPDAGQATSVFPSDLHCFTRRFPRSPFVSDPPDESVAGDPTKIQVDFPPKRDNTFWGLGYHATWQVPEIPVLGETELKGIFGFQRTESFSAEDFDGTDVPKSRLAIGDDSRQHSAEIQWLSSYGERFRWQLSGFFMRERATSSLLLQEYAFESLAGAITYLDIDGDQDVENESFGVALHTEFDFSSSVTLALGARYSKDVKRLRLLRDSVDAGIPSAELTTCEGGAEDRDDDGLPDERANPFPPFGIRAVAVPRCERKFRHVTGGARLEWRPTDASLIYAGAEHGYKAGGFANLGFGTYRPEFIYSYKLGAKSEFFDSRVRANVEAFFYDYKDLQLVVVDGIELRTETADARVWGVDLEAEISPILGLLLKAQVSFMDTRLKDYQSIDPTDFLNSRLALQCRIAPQVFQNCGNSTDFSGNELSRSPKWKVNLSAEYDIPLGDWGTLTPRVQYFWQDETFYRAFNQDLDLQEKYHLTDVRVTWRSPEETWLAEVFLNNIEDDSVYQNVLVGTRLAGAPYFAWYGPPRTWGVRIAYRY